MATSLAAVSFFTTTGRSLVHSPKLRPKKPNMFRPPSSLTLEKKSEQLGRSPKLSVCASYSEGNRDGGGDFVAGFLLGGALFGTAAYIFAPQIRRSLLNESEHGFARARKPVYYNDEGLETREMLTEKIKQLNSAIDNVYLRLRYGKHVMKNSENDNERYVV